MKIIKLILSIIFLTFFFLGNASAQIIEPIDYNFIKDLKISYTNILKMNNESSYNVANDILIFINMFKKNFDYNVSIEKLSGDMCSNEVLLKHFQRFSKDILNLNENNAETLLKYLNEYFKLMQSKFGDYEILKTYVIQSLINTAQNNIKDEKDLNKVTLFLKKLYDKNINTTQKKKLVLNINNIQQIVWRECPGEYYMELNNSKTEIPLFLKNEISKREKMAQLDKLSNSKLNNEKVLYKEINRVFLEIAFNEYNSKEKDKLNTIDEKAINNLIEKKYLNLKDKAKWLDCISIEPQK
ncbi:MAG: hypothetical protein QMC67_04705 [Candidatus Wallbacteria bacterium]